MKHILRTGAKIRWIAAAVLSGIIFTCITVPSKAQNALCDSLSVTSSFPAQPCCWQFTLKNHQPPVAGMIPICKVTVDILGPTGCTVAGAGGPGFAQTTSSALNVTWSFPGQLPSGDLTGFRICFDNNAFLSGPRLVFKWHACIQGATTVLCSDTMYLDCKPAPHRNDTCTIRTQDSVYCKKNPATGQALYVHDFIMRHNLGCTNSTATINVLSPAGLTIEPGAFPVGQTPAPYSFSISGPGAVAGATVVYTITVCCPATSGTERCCTDTVRITLPECQPKAECFQIAEQKVECQTGPAGIGFLWCFRLKNISAFTAYTFSGSAITPTVGVTVTPAVTTFTPAVPPGGTSGWICLSISGPGAIPGATVIMNVSMCGILPGQPPARSCCQGRIAVILPDCPVITDCCRDFEKQFDAVSLSASANGYTAVTGYLKAGPSNITRVWVTLSGCTINGIPCSGSFSAGTLTGFAPGDIPQMHEVLFGPAASVSLNRLTFFQMKLKFPALPTSHDVLQFCLRFRYTDAQCRTCDTLLCFSADRWHLFAPDLTLSNQQPRSKRGSGISSAGTAGIQGTLYGQDSGSLNMTLPGGPADGNRLTFVGMTITPVDTAVRVTDATAPAPFVFIPAGGSAYGFFTAHSGDTLSVGMKYNGLNGRNRLEHLISVYYTEPGKADTLTDEFVLTFRRQGMAGGDNLVSQQMDLTQLRTFALHIDNANKTAEDIERIVLRTGNGVQIVGIGPVGSDTSAVLKFTGTDGRRVLGALAVGADTVLNAGQTHGVIYLTLAGISGTEATVSFSTLNRYGQIISQGQVTLTGGQSAEAPTDATTRQATGLQTRCYPNPAGKSATIQFTLPAPQAHTRLRLSDISGREVADLIHDQSLPSGTHAVYVDLATLPSGNYIYQINAGGVEESGVLCVTK